MKKVWIEEGCIVCRACEDICPEVFVVEEEGGAVRGDADLQIGDSIEEAAKSCPVEAIRFSR